MFIVFGLVIQLIPVGVELIVESPLRKGNLTALQTLLKTKFRQLFCRIIQGPWLKQIYT